MRLTKHLIAAGAACFFAMGVLRAVDSTWNYAVEITAAGQVSPAQIALVWKQDTNGTPASYAVYRKPPTATNWGSPITTLPGSSTSFADTNVVAGTIYEYQVVKNAPGYKGYGYVQAGINVPLVDSRGTVILVVDKTYVASLASELRRLEADLIGDGWGVIRHDVGRNDSVVSVKNLIRADYSADPANVNTVFLFGHVPVPYSGLLNPDGHPEHLGAWPADVYYGDLDGQWTDSTVNWKQAGNSDPADGARLSNVSGDGKFDQSTVPGVVQLNVGRVDLANMPGYLQYQSQPSFPTEDVLLRQYLNKDHNFRHALVTVQRRALIGDYIGDKEGRAPAAAGFRSFAPLVGFGATSLTNLNVLYNDARGYWIPTLKTNDYLFALGCGAGSNATVSGLGDRPPYNDATTTDMVSNDVRAVFVMLFGSWCGDWDQQDNIVRSVLATPTYGLAAVYTGVPHWFLHPMGLGETIGYCARLTQNNRNPGLYETQVNESANMIHVALMGDPTLRLYPVAPASSLSGGSAAGQVTLSWVASPDASVVGYHVSRAASVSGPFTRLTGSPIGRTSFTDTAALPGATYMVRAVKLESTPSGSYFNTSQGVFHTSDGFAAATPDSRLVNLSVRSLAGTGSETLIVGFVIGGAGTSGSMPVLIRATGPALQAFGVDGVLADPLLTVYRDGTVVGQNDNWGQNAVQVSAAGSAVGAFLLPNSTSADAALTATYGSGAISVQVTGGGSSGIALAEVYDLTPSGSYTATMPRLMNVSARTLVGSGSGMLIVGFVVSGPTTAKVLIRGIGRGLEQFGVSGALAKPQLSLRASDGSVVATNAGWGGDPGLAGVFAQVGAFALDPASADSALLATLPPGAYTVQISGETGASGVVLAEVYEVR
ncbi:MAG: fibronectin type III domain-containing protein [Opitutaceae bacterium]|nr:fibronectin type III domain-containing protein [Opitutaceae bacterium]